MSSTGKATYIAQVLHDVEEVLGFLVVITELLNGLTSDEILGDLGPHLATTGVLRAVDADALLPLITAPIVVDLNAESAIAGVTVALTVALTVMVTVRSRGRRNYTPLITLRDELGAPNSTVLLPCDLGRGTTGTIQSYALGSGRNIDDGPVLGDTVVRLTHLAPRVDLGRDVSSFIVKVNVGRSLGMGTTAAAGDAAATLNVDMEATGIGMDQ